MIVFYIRHALIVCFIFTAISSQSLSLCAFEDKGSHNVGMSSKSVFKKFHTKWILDYLQTWSCYETDSDDVIQFAAEVKRKIQKFTHSRHHYSTLFREVHKRMKKRRSHVSSGKRI